MDKPTTLHRFLDDHQAAPFEWGRFDCCLAGADWVQLITGKDPMADYRGAYTTALGAARRMKADGGLAGAVARNLGALGFAEVPPAFAQRGDVAIVLHDGREHCGIVVAGGVAVTSKCGFETVNIRPVRAWRIE